ncbi:MAG: hypothetical protein KDE54_37690, partial [Caldilineaceae bacterium]|nr:hypothetical protein [Caldilineaceae bacterium]
MTPITLCPRPMWTPCAAPAVWP